MSEFISALKSEADALQPNVSVTENGALGYSTTGHRLVDLNFLLSSMRNWSSQEIWEKFLLAYNENPRLALLWLFFARDREQGCGERRTFRVIFGRFAHENPAAAAKLVPLIPFYGRWDDVTELCFGDIPSVVKAVAITFVQTQLQIDVTNLRHGKPVSLLAKWMPSENTSSELTRVKANEMRTHLNMTPRKYRKTLSELRRYIDVVEQKMSAQQWDAIKYEAVPSRAAMIYRGAFRKHDGERYEKYLDSVSAGEAKINSGMLFPYDIIHAYRGSCRKLDTTLEEQWKALPDKVSEGRSTLVVVDTSGSMWTEIGGTHVTCEDVAQSLGIYFAEKLKGPYHNSCILFSSRPKYIHFDDATTLKSKLDIIDRYDDCSDTNIEATFDLILNTAMKNHLRQSEIPANVLTISDMEFNSATCYSANKTLFDTIREKWESVGYKLPRLIFWNVCSRTGTIPVTTNDFGVALVSGFSPNIADMVMSGKLDPYEVLVDKLTSGRYDKVDEALKG